MQLTGNLYEETARARESAFGPVEMPVRFYDNGAYTAQEAREELHGEYHMIDLGALLDSQPASQLPVALSGMPGGFSPSAARNLEDILTLGDFYGYFQHPVSGDVGSRAIANAGTDGFRAVIADKTFDDDVPADVIESAVDRYMSYVYDRRRAAGADRDGEIMAAGRARLAEIGGVAAAEQKAAIDRRTQVLAKFLGQEPPRPEREASARVIATVPSADGRGQDALVYDPEAPDGKRFGVKYGIEPDEHIDLIHCDATASTLGEAYERIAARDPSQVAASITADEKIPDLAARVVAFVDEHDPYGLLDTKDDVPGGDVVAYTENLIREDPEHMAGVIEDMANESEVDASQLIADIRSVDSTTSLGQDELGQTELLHQAYLASLKLSQDGPAATIDGIDPVERYGALMSEIEDRSGLAAALARVEELEGRNAELETKVSELEGQARSFADYKEAHRYDVPGCTPDDVLETRGEYYDISPEMADKIAGEVNDALSVDDEGLSNALDEVMRSYEESGLIQPKDAEPASPAAGIASPAEEEHEGLDAIEKRTKEAADHFNGHDDGDPGTGGGPNGAVSNPSNIKPKKNGNGSGSGADGMDQCR